MVKAGTQPAISYAHRRTGRIVTAENWRLLSEKDRQEWEAAIAECEAQSGMNVQ